MADENPGVPQKPKQTLADDEIVTEGQFGRRSFLTAVGSILVGGAAALALGKRLEASSVTPSLQSVPNQKKTTNKKTTTTKKGAQSDPDQKKTTKKPMTKGKKGAASDPDQKKPG